MPKPHSYHMKATVWTPEMKSELAGLPHDIIPSCFWALRDKPLRREQVMDQMRLIDERLKVHEAADAETKAELMRKAGAL